LNFQQIAEMISEKLLHRFWFDSILKVGTLTTFCGQAIEIVDTGQYNLDQGPDFLFAIIKLGGQTWVGNVEVHIKTSDWFRHKHQYDQNYANTFQTLNFVQFSYYPIIMLHFLLLIPIKRLQN
jgi:hypothetical protein